MVPVLLNTSLLWEQSVVSYCLDYYYYYYYYYWVIPLCQGPLLLQVMVPVRASSARLILSISNGKFILYIGKLLPRLSSCLCVINTYRSLLFTLLPLSFGVHTHTIYWFTFLLMSCPHKYLNYVTTTISARHAFDLFLLLLTIQLSVAQPTPVCVIESILYSSVSTV